MDIQANRRVPTLDRGLARLLLGLIRLYQLAISRLMISRCRFTPSCSAYAYEAVKVHGAVRGSWLAVIRLGRCHPWNPGGWDPVPLALDPPRRNDA